MYAIVDRDESSLAGTEGVLLKNQVPLMKPLREWIDVLFDNQTSINRVLFRVDAGRIHGLSFGHVSRCLIISHALKNKFNCEPLFLMRNYTDGVAHVMSHRQKVSVLNSDKGGQDERIAILKALTEFRPDWLVVDLPYDDLDTSYFTEVKEKGIRILFIDDALFISPDADVILNSSILAPQKTVFRKDRNIRYFLGHQYFILDDSMVDRRADRKDGFFNVVITFGGSDPADLTSRAIGALIQKEWKGVLFRVVLGPGYPDADRIRRLTHNHSAFEVVVNPSSLIPLLRGSDLTICAGGRTVYELIYLNKQFFPVASALHEAEIINGLLKRGLIESGMTTWTTDQFINEVEKMVTKINRRVQ